MNPTGIRVPAAAPPLVLVATMILSLAHYRPTATTKPEAKNQQEQQSTLSQALITLLNDGMEFRAEYQGATERTQLRSPLVDDQGVLAVDPLQQPVGYVCCHLFLKALDEARTPTMTHTATQDAQRRSALVDSLLNQIVHPQPAGWRAPPPNRELRPEFYAVFVNKQYRYEFARGVQCGFSLTERLLLDGCMFQLDNEPGFYVNEIMGVGNADDVVDYYDEDDDGDDEDEVTARHAGSTSRRRPPLPPQHKNRRRQLVAAAAARTTLRSNRQHPYNRPRNSQPIQLGPCPSPAPQRGNPNWEDGSSSGSSSQ